MVPGAYWLSKLTVVRGIGLGAAAHEIRTASHDIAAVETLGLRQPGPDQQGDRRHYTRKSPGHEFLARSLIAAQNRPYLTRFRKQRAGEAVISGCPG